MGLGCVCSDYQAQNPIRLGLGVSVTIEQGCGRFVRNYPYATAEAIAEGRVDEAHKGTPWMAPDGFTK